VAEDRPRDRRPSRRRTGGADCRAHAPDPRSHAGSGPITQGRAFDVQAEAGRTAEYQLYDPASADFAAGADQKIEPEQHTISASPASASRPGLPGSATRHPARQAGRLTRQAVGITEQQHQQQPAGAPDQAPGLPLAHCPARQENQQRQHPKKAALGLPGLPSGRSGSADRRAIKLPQPTTLSASAFCCGHPPWDFLKDFAGAFLVTHFQVARPGRAWCSLLPTTRVGTAGAATASATAAARQAGSGDKFLGAAHEVQPAGSSSLDCGHCLDRRLTLDRRSRFGLQVEIDAGQVQHR